MVNPRLICMRCMSALPRTGVVCPACGAHAEELENETNQLPVGSILAGKYLAGCVLGQGGFGITYIGWDLNLGIKLAIKEYYPEGLVGRDSKTQSSVIPLKGEKGTYFLRGRDKFVEEARTLAKFAGDPGIVSVHDFFNENGTAYIVMDFVEGKTLKQIAEERNGKLTFKETLRYLLPVMGSLGNVHQAGLLHRDISPDNIIVTPEGRAVLLDFGAARRISAMGEHSNTINVKHGYAPEEQYRTHGEQGPWTDVYALCATIYRLTTGRTPTPAPDRVMSDSLLPPPNALGADLTLAQQAAIMKGLAIRGQNRQQSMRELKDQLRLKAGTREKNTKARSWRLIIIFGGITACIVISAAIMNLKVWTNNNKYLSTQIINTPSITTTAIVVDNAEEFSEEASSAGIESPSATILSQTPTLLLTPTPYPVPTFPIDIATATEIHRHYAIAANGDQGCNISIQPNGSITVNSIWNNGYPFDLSQVNAWSNIIAVSASETHAVGLTTDGMVIAVGSNYYGQCNVEDWGNVIAIAAGAEHTIGLVSDGTVIATGRNDDGQCNISEWEDIVDIAAGGAHSVGIESDRTVVAKGWNYFEQCKVYPWRNIVSIAASQYHTVGLKTDGTVVATGWNHFGECKVSTWTDIVAIEAGLNCTVGLKKDGTVIAVGDNRSGQLDTILNWDHIVAIYTSAGRIFGVQADGTIVAQNFSHS